MTAHAFPLSPGHHDGPGGQTRSGQSPCGAAASGTASFGFVRSVAGFLLAAGTLLLAGCEAPIPQSEQGGFRGTSMGRVDNPRTLAAKIDANQMPEAQPAADTSGPKVRDLPQAYQNVKILGDLSEGEFLRTMTAITEWVSPQQEDGSGGCGYCHNLENMADDSKYTHKVARRMFQMNATINLQWANHVGQTGVTCYTCHRGQPVPAHIWFRNPGPPQVSGALGNRNEQNWPATSVGYATLPFDPFTELLKTTDNIRVIRNQPLPRAGQPLEPLQDTEKTYGLMMHMSRSLGVNCTFCHNSRSFGSWSTSPPQRMTAWYGLRMVRDLNAQYLEPLQPVYPPERLGSAVGDAPKAYCTTCHQGLNKPLNGAQMAKDYPELNRAARN
jgi:photosynthetic reaction center cytochrome c subunit